MMENLYLVATIASQPVAIRASAIESVVDIGEITAVPLAPPHVAGLAALRSRVLTMICCERALGMTPSPRPSTRAVVVAIDGHHYGLLVGAIDDACVIEEPPRAVRSRLHPGWARVVEGMLSFGDDTLLLVDPTRMIAGSDAIAA